MRIDDSDLPLLSGSGGQRRGKSVSPVADEACRFPWVSPVADLRTADQKSAGASDTLEAPVMIGGPSRTRTLDPLIKSHLGLGSIGHHRAESAAITRLERVGPVS